MGGKKEKEILNQSWTFRLKLHRFLGQLKKSVYLTPETSVVFLYNRVMQEICHLALSPWLQFAEVLSELQQRQVVHSPFPDLAQPCLQQRGVEMCVSCCFLGWWSKCSRCMGRAAPQSLSFSVMKVFFLFFLYFFFFKGFLPKICYLASKEGFKQLESHWELQ